MKKNKVGLVSVTNHNYGSILQTYALQTAVRNIGYSTEIIYYREGKLSKLKRLLNIEYAWTRLKVIYKQALMNIVHTKQKKLLSARAFAFCNFIESNLTFSPLCNRKSMLEKLAMSYDVVLLGSDQVWHPMNLLMDFFTLNFVPDAVRKGAYAPSFGVSKISPRDYEAYKKYIRRIDYVSCREMAGVKIIKELTGREVPLVCDPTLLLTAEDWDNSMSDKVKISEKYLFCYFIGNNPNQRETVKVFAAAHNLKVVALLHIDEYIASDEKYADYSPYNVGPAEFLYLIKNAECIMTDSFHATVFSLQFHKDFYTFNRFENGKGNSTSSRIDTLLKTFDLIDRKVAHSIGINNLTNKKIDYNNVDERLNKFRKFSVEYLKSIFE